MGCVTEEEESRRTARFHLEPQQRPSLRWGILEEGCTEGRENQELDFACPIIYLIIKKK